MTGAVTGCREVSIRLGEPHREGWRHIDFALIGGSIRLLVQTVQMISAGGTNGDG